MTANLLVSGWYTPDYMSWYRQLEQDLLALNLPSLFFSAEPTEGSWESATKLKPTYMRMALERAEGKPVLFVDVDCRIHGPKERIFEACAIQTDIAFRMSAKVKRGVRLRMHPWSGTMILKPTEATYDFLDLWDLLNDEASPLAPDEITLGLAMTQVPGLTVTMLPKEFCAGPKDPKPVICHPHRTGVRSSKWQKLLHGIMPW